MSETEENLQSGVERLNNLQQVQLANELLKCCGSIRWAKRMVGERPFADFYELVNKADAVWWSLDREDWLEAFSSHPKIGEKRDVQPHPMRTERWSDDEQYGTLKASREMRSELAEANRAYEARFGYIFIVCATGKSGDEMLALLKERLHNDPETELRVAAEEQRRITRLRLNKLLTESPNSQVSSPKSV